MMHEQFTKRQRNTFYVLILCLLLPALLINLGLLAFIDDEALRALVALEMDYSGNYITPTVQGEFYYRKPPLYNWFLLIWYHLFGRLDEFVTRFATLFCLLGYALTIFIVSKRYYSTKFAFLNALFLITCGRILIYDSMLGLIDIGYSWVTFGAFMVIFHQYQKKNYFALFALSYFLTACGFLLKGLPSIVFQGATLLAFFIWKKDYKTFFSWAHVTGGLLFVLVVGAYYFTYNQYNSLTEVFNTLLFESSRRTATSYGMSKTILHLFTFPFEVIFHFLPWTILVALFFQKGIRQLLTKDPFIFFCGLTFMANIPVYWISVEVYPRYLFMHIPLLFTVLLYLWFYSNKELSLQRNIVHGVLAFAGVVLLIGMLLPMFLERSAAISHVYLKSSSLTLGLGFLLWLFLKKKQERLLITIAILLVARIGFNWFIIPDRYAEDRGTKVKLTSQAAGEKYKDADLFAYKNSILQITNLFYITEASGKILYKKHEDFEEGEVYFINSGQYKKAKYTKSGEVVEVRYENITLDITNDIKNKK